MPTYEYECRKCGHQMEAVQSIKAPPLTRCPECKGRLQRLISRGGGLLFKGSGFYATDYRSESYKKGAGADKPPVPAPAPTPAPAAPTPAAAEKHAKKSGGKSAT